MKLNLTQGDKDSDPPKHYPPDKLYFKLVDNGDGTTSLTDAYGDVIRIIAGRDLEEMIAKAFPGWKVWRWNEQAEPDK